MRRTKYRRYSQEALEEAVAKVKRDKISLREAARRYSIPIMTLSDKVSGKTDVNCRQGKASYLTMAEETKISLWAQEMARIGYGQTKRDIKQVVKKIIDDDGRRTPFRNNEPGEKWFSLFLRRHPELSQRMPQKLGTQRALVTAEKLQKWYNGLESFLTAEGAIDILQDPTRMFNCDESGFALSGKTERVIAERGVRTVSSHSGTDNMQITVLVTVSADGIFLPPTLVYAGQRFRINPLEGGPENAYLGRSKNGWMDSEVFYGFMTNCFNPFLTHQEVKRPVLLLVDGHTSHLSMEVGEFCQNKGIYLYCFPSHCSHILQPCDLAVFRPLKAAWTRKEREYRYNHPGQCVGKLTFARIFKQAWDEVSTKSTIAKNGFRAAGLYPFTKQFLREKVTPSSIYRPRVGATEPQIQQMQARQQLQAEPQHRIQRAEPQLQRPPADQETLQPAQDPSIDDEPLRQPGTKQPRAGPSRDASRVETNGNRRGPSLESFISPVLEKHLSFPSVARSPKKKNIQDFPKCVSSIAYLSLMRDKQRKKQDEEEKKKKRKEEREESSRKRRKEYEEKKNKRKEKLEEIKKKKKEKEEKKKVEREDKKKKKEEQEVKRKKKEEEEEKKKEEQKEKREKKEEQDEKKKEEREDKKKKEEQKEKGEKREEQDEKKKEEREEKKKEEREEKKKKKEQEEKRKKKKEEEEKKNLREEKKKAKEAIKKTQEIDVNMCPGCEGAYDDDPEEWVGCLYCPRWYHIVCCTELEGMTDEEIAQADFRCPIC